jgi:tetratricopeptide (TPR) repeat protein
MRPNIYLSLFICILINGFAYGQFQNVIDSMRSLPSQDRCRILQGYREYRADMMSDPAINRAYLEVMNAFAVSSRDLKLQQEIAFIRTKVEQVYIFPREQWEERYRELILHYKKEDNQLRLGHCYHALGQLQFEREEYTEALENSLRALKIFKSIGYDKVSYIGKVLHEISLICFQFKDHEKIVELMEIALKLPPYNPNLDIQRYNNLAIVYSQQRDFPRAKYFYKLAHERATLYKSETWQGITGGNLAQIYGVQKQFDSAHVYYVKNYNRFKKDTIHYVSRLNSMIFLADNLVDRRSVTEAKQLLDQVQSLHRHQGRFFTGDLQQLHRSMQDYYEVRKKYHNAIGQYKTALAYNDSLGMTLEKTSRNFNKLTVRASTNKIEVEFKDEILAVLKAEKTQARLLQSLLITGILIIGGYGYLRLQRSRRKEKTRSMELLKETKTVLRTKQQATSELQEANSEIERFMALISDRHEIQMSEVKTNNENSPDLRDAKILTDDDWAAFQHHFELRSPGFQNKIRKYAPDITASELRYLMLVSLNFTHKEMASALGVSDSSIRVTWNRVRKRLGGTLEDTPHTLLQQALDRG